MTRLPASSDQALLGPQDTLLSYALLATLWLATLPLGSKRTFAMVALAYAVFALAVWATWIWRRHGQMAWARLKAVRWPLGLLLALAAWMGLQALPLPEELVRAVSPEAWAVQRGVVQQFTLSLDPAQTRVQAALALALALYFALVVLVLRDRLRMDAAVMGLVLIGLFQALLGLALWSLKARYPMLHYEVVHDMVKGTYGNRNHMAGFLVLVMSMGIGLMLARLGSGRPGGPTHWRGRLRGVLAFVLSDKMRLRLMLVILVIALVLTRSRMGNTAFFAALLVTGLLALALARHAAPAMLALVMSLVLIDVLVVGTWVGLERVIERIQETDLRAPQAPPPSATATIGSASSAGSGSGPATAATGPAPAPRQGRGREESVEERQLAARYALDLAHDFPWTGTGAGSFYGAFLRYRPPGEAFIDHAHNDYAETLANLGVVGLGLKGLLVLLSAATFLRTLARRQSSMARGMAFGALMATIGMAVHATVDFNLQIPANALLMTGVLAIGWAARLLPSPVIARYARPR